MKYKLPAAFFCLVLLVGCGGKEAGTGPQSDQSNGSDRPCGAVENNEVRGLISDYCEKEGKDISAWSCAVDRVSKEDPNWKRDMISKPGNECPFFLLKKDGKSNTWEVFRSWRAYDRQLQAELKSSGVPDDILSTVYTHPTSELQVLMNYCTKYNLDVSEMSVRPKKESKENPAWDLLVGICPGKADYYFVMCKDNGSWQVKGAGSNIDNTHGMPDDMKSGNVE